MTVGERIKQCRTQKGMTQKELAHELKIAYQNISRYESGKVTPKPDTLKRIAKALDVDPLYLQEGVSFSALHEALHRATAHQFPDLSDKIKELATAIDTSSHAKELAAALNIARGQAVEGENQKDRLTANYDALNDHSRERLVEYSDDLVSNPQNRRDPEDE